MTYNCIKHKRKGNAYDSCPACAEEAHIADLQKQLAEAREEIAERDDRLAQNDSFLTELELTNDSLRAERDALRDGLRTYGRHDVNCLGQLRNHPCDCGLAKLLEEK